MRNIPSKIRNKTRMAMITVMVYLWQSSYKLRAWTPRSQVSSSPSLLFSNWHIASLPLCLLSCKVGRRTVPSSQDVRVRWDGACDRLCRVPCPLASTCTSQLSQVLSCTQRRKWLSESVDLPQGTWVTGCGLWLGESASCFFHCCLNLDLGELKQEKQMTEK